MGEFYEWYMRQVKANIRADNKRVVIAVVCLVLVMYVIATGLFTWIALR